MTDLKDPVIEPGPAEVPEELLDYEGTLSYSQLRRKRIVDALMVDERPPEDPKVLNVILKALGDMDKTALQDRKNNIDQGNADSSKAVAEAMRDFIMGQKNINPFARTADGSTGQRAVASPDVDLTKLGEHELVKGEEVVGVVHETYNEFIERMENPDGKPVL